MKKRVLVIGDFILDVYKRGNYIKKNSDNSFVFLEKDIIYMAGGAGNVASNLAQAGIPTTLIGILGIDQDSKYFQQALDKNKVNISPIIVEKDWKISIKTRYMVHEKQVFRSDRECTETDTTYAESAMIKYLSLHMDEFYLIVLVDYTKGVLSAKLVTQIIQLANQHKKRIITDSKSNDIIPFKGSYLVKMNHQELSIIAGKACNSLDMIRFFAQQIKVQCQCNYVLITWGEKGVVFLFEDSSVLHVKNHLNIPVLCPIGAGDTIMAFLIAGIVNDFSIVESLFLANYAAETAISLPMTTVLYNMSYEKQLELIKKANIYIKNLTRKEQTINEQNIAWNQHWA